MKKAVRFLKVAAGLVVLVLVALVAINLYVVKSQEKYVLVSLGEAGYQYREGLENIKEKKVDCILVLGAAVQPDGTPSRMLRDRLDFAVELYKEGVAPKLLLSGDNGQVEYNEVEAMKRYVLAAGVPEEAVFLDHAGFSTYETMYRAREVFRVKTAIVVTQRYHIYRAVYIGRRLGMDVYGASSDQKSYQGQIYREFREILARDKDFVKCIYKPKPTFLGEPIPIDGPGCP